MFDHQSGDPRHGSTGAGPRAASAMTEAHARLPADVASGRPESSDASAAARISTCAYVFRHPGAPKGSCWRPPASGDRCVFHTGVRDVEMLVEAVRNGDWLEGVIVDTPVVGKVLSRAKMPYAIFEGIAISRSCLDHSLLYGASFRSSVIEAVIFRGSDLANAIFDMATCVTTAQSTFSADFRDCELGGLSGANAAFRGIQILGARFSSPTRLVPFIAHPSAEVQAAQWSDAAVLYASLSRRAAQDGDYGLSDELAYSVSTYRHRAALRAGRMRSRSPWRNWIWPTIRHPSAVLWLLSRFLWGYGFRPWRCLIGVLAVIATGFAFAFANSGCSSIFDSIVWSLMSFTGASGGTVPGNTSLERFIFGLDALVGTVLLSLFLISMTGKYARRM